MWNSALVLSFLSSARGPASRGRAVPSPSPRARWGWLALLRESIGGALLLAVWLALWTIAWAAVAGPLSPVREAGAPRAAPVSSVEAT